MMIYLITTITDFTWSERFQYYELASYRTVGYYLNKENAIDSVVHNSCDIFETCYDYCIIEAVHEGIYDTDVESMLFKFNLSTGKYEKIEPPEKFFNVFSKVIG